MSREEIVVGSWVVTTAGAPVFFLGRHGVVRRIADDEALVALYGSKTIAWLPLEHLKSAAPVSLRWRALALLESYLLPPRILKLLNYCAVMATIAIAVTWAGGPWWHAAVLTFAIVATNVLGYAEGLMRRS